MTGHTTTVDGPTAEGHWAWHCLDDDCPGEGDDPDLGVVLSDAGGHGPLSHDTDIVRIAETAASVDGVDKALAYYDDHLIPKWERDFPEKVYELHAQRAEFQAKRDLLLSPIDR